MLRELHKELGIPASYGQDTGHPVCGEPAELVKVGPNLVGRMQRLVPDAAREWKAMVAAAELDSVPLMIVSGFRSIEYQAALIRKKIDAGQTIDEILIVNAAPGHSEHHTGLAIDIATPGSRPLTEEFEATEAFRWLGVNGARFGYSMTYPRHNPWGIAYEPWHWCQKDEKNRS